MFERFTDRARRLVVLAQEEARILSHNYIGTEHLLLGLIHMDDATGTKALVSIGLNPELIRQEVEEIIGLGQKSPPGHIPFTPRSKKVLELSLREALQLGHNYIGTEHILLGLIHEGEGVAAQVLVKYGADLNRVRQQIITLVHGYAPESSQRPGSPSAQQAPRPAGPMGRWAEAHLHTVGQPEEATARTDVDLCAAVAGLPLLARAGIAVPLALLLDLVRLTGSASPVDARVRALGSQAGVGRLRTLAWPPAARVALAGLLVGDLPPDPAFAAPDAAPRELRDALTAALRQASAGPRELRDLDEQIAEVRRVKERYIDQQDFERAAAIRDTEKQLIRQKEDLERQWREAQPAGLAAGDLREPVREQRDWQVSGDIFDALCASAAEITEFTLAMLDILGPVAAAAEPTLPLKVRHRISALPQIGLRERRLIADSVALSTERSGIAATVPGAITGTNGVSRRGKITGLLPAQLALPEDLLEYRFVGRELLYRVNEASAQTPPEAVTIVLDTTPATYGPAETVLRLVAHVITVTLWTVGKTPTLVSLDHPGLVRPLTAPADLATLWTARTLEPPDVHAALATARELGTSAILLTEHHLIRDLPVIPHPRLRVLTTHVGDDRPTGRTSGPFHVHLPPTPTAAQVVTAVFDLLRPVMATRGA